MLLGKTYYFISNSSPIMIASSIYVCNDDYGVVICGTVVRRTRRPYMVIVVLVRILKMVYNNAAINATAAATTTTTPLYTAIAMIGRFIGVGWYRDNMRLASTA